jgi:hypothetical protein
MRTTEARLRAVEARLAEIEGGYGESIYPLHRGTVQANLGISRVLQHLGLPQVTDDEVDAALDEQ